MWTTKNSRKELRLLFGGVAKCGQAGATDLKVRGGKMEWQKKRLEGWRKHVPVSRGFRRGDKTYHVKEMGFVNKYRKKSATLHCRALGKVMHGCTTFAGKGKLIDKNKGWDKKRFRSDVTS